MLTRSFSTEVPELKSNQEEDVTRLVLHTKHPCDSSLQIVPAVSEDTDIIALLLDLLNGQLFTYYIYFTVSKLKIVKDFQIFSSGEVVFQLTSTDKWIETT